MIMEFFDVDDSVCRNRQNVKAKVLVPTDFTYFSLMRTPIKMINFDRNKHPGIDFDIIPLEHILDRKDLNHDPKLPHQVEFYLMVICTEGLGSHSIDFNTISYQPGTILTIRKDQIHHFSASDAKGYLFLFTEEFVVSFLERKEANKVRELFNELLFVQRTQLEPQQYSYFLPLINEIQQEFHSPFDDHTSGIIRNLLQVLISRLHRIKRTHEPERVAHKYIGQFLEFQKLVEHQCTTYKSVNYYADQLHVTTKTLNNITHQVIHKNAKTFIDETLMLQIKRLLINSNISIKEIAYQSGFTEPSNLFKFFKRFSSNTPEEFRNSNTTH